MFPHIKFQCLKLRVHPVCTFWWPGAHVLEPVHPAGAYFSKIVNMSIYRVPTQVLQSLIFVFPFVRPYKVLFFGYFHPEGLIKSYFCYKSKFQNWELYGPNLELKSPNSIHHFANLQFLYLSRRTLKFVKTYVL